MCSICIGGEVVGHERNFLSDHYTNLARSGSNGPPRVTRKDQRDATTVLPQQGRESTAMYHRDYFFWFWFLTVTSNCAELVASFSETITLTR